MATGLPRGHRHDPVTSRAGGCPELDCIRHLLPGRIVAAAERRARAIGVGAERVLICADAITEEAYLTALASSLGTSYERFDGISREDCPLDDDRLIEAAAAGLLPFATAWAEIIIAPPIGPRTKPKALNVALPFARGAYTVVYDAEDKPEPDQLRRALDAFRKGGNRLACVQASLTIDNTADNWLAGMFTANYAGQFDVFLRGLAALQLPFPLGGSSNHFRTAVLRKAGGWDSYNVTEDADLGIRLYRLGYRATAIASTTYEEAPARFVPWLKQRSRWYKGWMQTWFVHMRRPGRLFRELTPAGAIAFQIFFAANVLAALIHPLFMAGLGFTLYALPTPWANTVMENAAPIFVTSLLSGYASTIVLDVIGLRRRGLLGQAWVLMLTPLHWLLLSVAAWRALFQLIYDPQRWEKTEHGMARTSRVAGSHRLRSHASNHPNNRAKGRRKSHARNWPSTERTIRASQQIGPGVPIAPIKIMQTARGTPLGALNGDSHK